MFVLGNGLHSLRETSDGVVEESERQKGTQVHQAETRIPPAGQEKEGGTGSCHHAVQNIKRTTH